MRKWWMVWLLGMLTWGLVACETATPAPTPTATATPRWLPLTPYLSPTPSTTPTPDQAPWLPTSVLPTPTPFVHTIQKGDTLLGIALQYGVDVDALREANPALNPNLMPIGATVVIPLDKENPAGLPTPTPMPLPMGPLACYPQADGSAWCLVVVRNDAEEAVEALTGWLRWGEQETSMEALVNRLPPGARTVLLAHLPRFVDESAPQAYLLTALPVDAATEGKRYLPAEAQMQVTTPLPSRVVTVRGTVTWLADSTPREVWLVLVGYAADGRPVAARRWTFVGEQLGEGGLPFSGTLYALGPPISRVEALVEAHP